MSEFTANSYGLGKIEIVVIKDIANRKSSLGPSPENEGDKNAIFIETPN